MRNYNNVGKDAVLLIEDTSSKIKKSLSTNILDLATFSETKKDVNKLIKTAYKGLKNMGYIELAVTTRISFMEMYIQWKNLIIATLATSQIGQRVVEYLDQPGQPNKNSFAVSVSESSQGFAEYKASDLRNAITTNRFGEGQIHIDNYTKSVEKAMTELVDSRATFRDSMNRKLSLRNLAEMTTRYRARQEDLEELKTNGSNYVLASQHVNPSVRCQPFQGKIYLIDVDPSMIIQGKIVKEFTPTPLGKIDGLNYYSLKEAMEHGFLGYNCRHRLVEYKKGMHIPPPISAKEIEREREIDTTMRDLENKIRHAKEGEYLDTQNRKKYVEESKRLQRVYRKYAEANNQVDYRWRYTITLSERELKKII